VVVAASEHMLEQNRFYLQLQFTSTKQKEEISTLQQAISEMKKENELLKEQNQTYWYVSMRIPVQPRILFAQLM
jgi:hypothetical protein